MIKNDSKLDGDKKCDEQKKKTYHKPQILSVERLEIVAATCEGSKADSLVFPCSVNVLNS
jgi:hypothetical protein